MDLTLEQLQGLEPVRGLSAPRLRELMAWCRVDALPAGAALPQPLSDGLQLVYLLSGEAVVVLPDGVTRVLVGSCDQARWPLGYKTTLPVSGRAITDLRLLRLDFDLLDRMMTWDELAAVAGQPAGDATPAPPAWTALAGAFPAETLFTGALARLPAAHIHELLAAFVRMPMRAGREVIREGEPGDDYYLVESGRCRVTRQVGGSELRLAELRAGDAFGEEALVSGAPRNATVRMLTDGVLLRLAKADFLRLLQAPLLRQCARGEAEARVRAGQARWLDVRYPAEFAQDGLPGAINVPLNEIRSAFPLLDPRLEYITCCQSGRRAAAAAFLLARHGFVASCLDHGLAGEPPHE